MSCCASWDEDRRPRPQPLVLPPGAGTERDRGSRTACRPERDRCGACWQRGAHQTGASAPIHASDDEVGRVWPGAPHADTLHRGRLAVASLPAGMRAGVQETIDVYVTNESTETWRFGKEARPEEIRLGYHWSLDGESVDELVYSDAASIRSPPWRDSVRAYPCRTASPSRKVRASARHLARRLRLLRINVAGRAGGARATIAGGVAACRSRSCEHWSASRRCPRSNRWWFSATTAATVAPLTETITASGLRQPLLAGLESSGRLTRSVRFAVAMAADRRRAVDIAATAVTKRFATWGSVRASSALGKH